MFTLPVDIYLMHDDVCLPRYGSARAVGLDICAYIKRCDSAYNDVTIEPGKRHVFSTGIKMAFCEAGWYARVAPRSGLAVKHGIDVLAGVIDSDYRGEIMICLINHGERPVTIKNGDRIAQIIFENADRANLFLVDRAEDLGATARGDGGFGSTGLQ